MPKDPEYKLELPYRLSVEHQIQLHGAEYQHPLQGTHDHNVPCAVCHVSTISALLLIPAKYSCPGNWTMEYYGYLMSENKNHERTHFACVDHDMEGLPGCQASTPDVFYIM